MVAIPVLDAVLHIGDTLLTRLLPDPEQRARAQLELATLAQQGELKDLELRLSAIVTEAQSTDPWTSRARPTFLYVCYTLILASIPMGVLYAVSPTHAQAIATGFQTWLQAIPEPIVTLMGVGYLGYTGARSIDKWKAAT